MMMRPKEVHHYLPFTDQVAKDFVQRIQEVKSASHEVNNLRLLASKWNLEGEMNYLYMHSSKYGNIILEHDVLSIVLALNCNLLDEI